MFGGVGDYLYTEIMAPQNIAPANSASPKAEGIGKKETTEDAKKEEAVAKKEAAEDKQKEKKAAAPQVVEDKPDWHWIQDTTTGLCDRWQLSLCKWSGGTQWV